MPTRTRRDGPRGRLGPEPAARTRQPRSRAAESARCGLSPTPTPARPPGRRQRWKTEMKEQTAPLCSGRELRLVLLPEVGSRPPSASPPAVCPWPGCPRMITFSVHRGNTLQDLYKENCLCSLTSPPPPLANGVCQDACVKENSHIVAKTDLLGKKYLIQNGKLGGFSFFHLGITIVLSGLLRAFKIPICFYRNRPVEGIWTCALFFGPRPHFCHDPFHCCHRAPRTQQTLPAFHTVSPENSP